LKSRFPHPLTLLVGCVLVAAALTWILPAGEYERQFDAVSGRDVVVAGTFHAVESNPVGFFEAIVALPRGMAAAADVVFLIFLAGAAFAVVEATGAIETGMRWLIHRLGNHEILIIPIVSLFFAIGGITENMQEEIIALIPILVVLCGRLGYTPLVGVAMSFGSAVVASAFSPMNPFQVGIAQKVSDVPLLSGWEFRTVFLVIALAIWIVGTMRHANQTRVVVAAGESSTDGQASDDLKLEPGELRRHLLILGMVGLSFLILIWGLLFQGWDFDHLTGLFFLMGVLAGLIGGLGLTGTSEAYGRGFRDMAFAAILVGVARAIFVVLDDGRIVDTIVHGMFTPIEDLPLALSGIGMMVAHAVIHVPVPSVSGHAVLTMPILAPLGDLLGMSRQIVILCYQYGAGIFDMIVPTSGALLAILAAGGVRYEEWMAFAFRQYLVLTGLGAVAVLIALGIGLQ
jgi:uncharacterized ion transporter superfamily protein YfcC